MSFELKLLENELKKERQRANHLEVAKQKNELIIANMQKRINGLEDARDGAIKERDKALLLLCDTLAWIETRHPDKLKFAQKRIAKAYGLEYLYEKGEQNDTSRGS